MRNTPWVMTWKRFIRKPSGVIGGAICLFLLTLALLAPALATHDPFEQKLENRKQPPSTEHYFGTDDFGRDIYSRILYGARITLRVGVTAVGIALLLGIPLALLAVSGGRLMDLTVTGIIDVFLALPSLVLAMAIVAIFGPNLTNAMIAIGIVYMPRMARVVRSAALTESQQEYIMAARALSCSLPRVLFRHLFPNCIPPLMVAATLHLASAILEAAALSFLGLGAKVPTPEWGAMLKQGRELFLEAPYMIYFPGLAIFLAVLGINLLGDALNDTLGGR